MRCEQECAWRSRGWLLNNSINPSSRLLPASVREVHGWFDLGCCDQYIKHAASVEILGKGNVDAWPDLVSGFCQDSGGARLLRWRDWLELRAGETMTRRFCNRGKGRRFLGSWSEECSEVLRYDTGCCEAQLMTYCQNSCIRAPSENRNLWNPPNNPHFKNIPAMGEGWWLYVCTVLAYNKRLVAFKAPSRPWRLSINWT